MTQRQEGGMHACVQEYMMLPSGDAEEAALHVAPHDGQAMRRLEQPLVRRHRL